MTLYIREEEWVKIDKYVEEGHSYREIWSAIRPLFRRARRPFYKSHIGFKVVHKKRLKEQEAARPKYRMPA